MLMEENDGRVFFGALGIAAVVILLLLLAGQLQWPDPEAQAAAVKAAYDAGHQAGLHEGGRAARTFKCATSR